MKAQSYTAEYMDRPAQAVSVNLLLFAFEVYGSGNVTVSLVCFPGVL